MAFFIKFPAATRAVAENHNDQSPSSADPASCCFPIPTREARRIPESHCPARRGRMSACPLEIKADASVVLVPPGNNVLFTSTPSRHPKGGCRSVGLDCVVSTPLHAGNMLQVFGLQFNMEYRENCLFSVYKFLHLHIRSTRYPHNHTHCFHELF